MLFVEVATLNARAYSNQAERVRSESCSCGHEYRAHDMPWYDVIWNYEPGGNVEHVGEHGLTPEDVEAVIRDPLERRPAPLQVGLWPRAIRRTDG